MRDFGLYVIITRPRIPYGEVARVCVERGVRMLQLREKELDDRALLAAAAEIRAVTRGTETRFVMNDRADLALLAEADAVHLGQGDISLEQARRIVGAGAEAKGGGMLIGLSTHSEAQAREAIAAGADYIGFGPVYATPTKAVPDPTVGVELLREVVGFSPVPVVAIGGIFPENLPDVVAAGARNVCSVRYLMEADTAKELGQRIERLQEMI